MNLRRRLQREDGVALLLALAFISLLGIFTVAILSVTWSDFKTTEVVRTRTDALYGADGAADFALEQVQPLGDTCPTGTSTLSPPSINGATTTVTYTCTGGTTTSTVASTNAFLGSYSLVATGAVNGWGIYVGDTAPSTNNPPTVMNVYGDAYSLTHDNLVVGSGSDANKLVINGKLSIADSPCNFGPTTDPQVTTTPNGCLASQSPPPLTINPPKVAVPSTSAAAMQTGTGTNSNCRILYPGKYGSGGLAFPTFDSTKGYYLASGTYYFNDTGEKTLAGYIQGGGQQTATSPSTVTNPLMTSFRTRCPAAYANDANAHSLSSGYTASGSGVTLVFGGSSYVVVADGANSQVELFPRVAPAGAVDAAGDDGVTLWARNSTSGANPTANYNPSSVYDFYWTKDDSTATNVVVHGFTYMPDAKLYTRALTNAGANGVAQLEGGAYLSKLDLLSGSNQGTAPIVGKPATVTVNPAARVVTFTITTPLPGGGGNTVITLIAQYPVGGGVPTITSWRKA